MSRYCKFFRGLRNSPCREVAVLASFMARDRRSVTGSKKINKKKMKPASTKYKK
jgi:hypothetical protein